MAPDSGPVRRLATHFPAGQTNSSADRAWIGLVLAGTLTLCFWTIWQPFGRDQGIHATIAFALDEGLLPYRDVYNIKPPMTTVAHWLSQVIFGHQAAAIRLFDLAAVMATAAGIFAVVRRLGQAPFAAALSGLLFAAFHGMLSYWNQAQTDGWAGFLLVPSFWAVLRGWQSGGGGRGWLALGGCLLTLAFAFKYTVAVFGLVLFVPYLAGGDYARLGLRPLAWFIAGGVVTLSVIVGAMAASGLLPDFLEIQAYTLNYAALETDDAANPLAAMTQVIGPSPALAALFLIGLATLPFRGDVPAWARLALATWLLSAAATGFLQGKGFPYHFLPLLPPAAIIAGIALARILGQVLPWGGTVLRRAGLVALGLGALLALQPTQRGFTTLHLLSRDQSPTPVWERDFLLSDYGYGDMRAASAAIDALPGPKQTLFVWGFDSGLYFLQGVPPRYRYPYSWPLVVAFSDGRYEADLLARLRASPPQTFVVQIGDVAPHATGIVEDSRQMLDALPELKTFLGGRYQLALALPRYEIWRLNGVAGP